jgi:hypothetical protein
MFFLDSVSVLHLLVDWSNNLPHYYYYLVPVFVGFYSNSRSCRPQMKGKVRYVDQENYDSGSEYIVNEKDLNENIEIKVGGVELSVIIDSGASVNVISNAVWEKLKENKIKCKSINILENNIDP